MQSKGISRDRIDISTGAGTANARTNQSTGTTDVNPVSGSERDENSVRRTSDDRTVDPEGRNTNVFTDFFNNLFGGGNKDDAGRFSHVAQRAEAIVTVHAQSEEEAERAAEIMDDCGAMDVDKKAYEYGYTADGTSGGINERSTSTGSTSANEDLSSGSSGRSRIFNRRLEDDMRLRDFKE